MPNLLERQTLERFFDGSEIDKFYMALAVFRDLNVNPGYFEVDERGCISVKGDTWEEKIPLQTILNTALKLRALQGCTNFDSLSNSLNNPSQFGATIFEINCGYYILKQLKITNLTFSPTVTVGKREKHPDFLSSFYDNVLFYSECKSIDSYNRAKRSRALRIMQVVSKKIKNVIGSDYKVEIAFHSLPTHWNRNFGDQLTAVVETLASKNFTERHIELNIDNKQKTLIKLCRKNEKKYFNCSLYVADQHKDMLPSIIVGEILSLQKDINLAIKDALTQLPQKDHSLIFILSINENDASKAISSFFKNNKYPNLMAIISWTDKARIHKNDNCRIKIKDYIVSKQKSSTVSTGNID